MNLKLQAGFILIILIMLSGCAVSYGPKGAMGGYSEELIDEVTALVAFEGNQHNSVDEIRTYLSYRCAELTLARGFSHFLIMEDASFKESSGNEFESSDITFKTRTSMSGGVNSRVSSTFGAQETNSNPIGIFRIKMMRGPDPVYITASINAQVFMDTNEQLIKRKK